MYKSVYLLSLVLCVKANIYLNVYFVFLMTICDSSNLILLLGGRFSKERTVQCWIEWSLLFRFFEECKVFPTLYLFHCCLNAILNNFPIPILLFPVVWAKELKCWE